MNRKKDFPLQAVNNIVFVKKEDAPSEIGGLLLPDSAKTPTNKGEILSVGDKVDDEHIRKGVGKIGIFNQGAGRTLEDEGVEYWYVTSENIICVK